MLPMVCDINLLAPVRSNSLRIEASFAASAGVSAAWVGGVDVADICAALLVDARLVVGAPFAPPLDNRINQSVTAADGFMALLKLLVVRVLSWRACRTESE